MSNVLSELQQKVLLNVSDVLKEFVCHLCKKTLDQCVRITVCGHYFCTTCLDINSKQCPVCKQFFEIKEIDREPSMNAIIGKVRRMERLLKNVDDSTTSDATSLQESTCDKKESKDRDEGKDEQKESKDINVGQDEQKESKDRNEGKDEQKESKDINIGKDEQKESKDINVGKDEQKESKDRNEGKDEQKECKDINVGKDEQKECKDINVGKDEQKESKDRNEGKDEQKESKDINVGKDEQKESKDRNEGKDEQPVVFSNTFSYKGSNFEISFVEFLGRRNAKGETLMHTFCKKRDANKVFKQIADKQDINAKDFAGWTPLHEAIESGSEEIVKELLTNGANPNVPGENYVTPLHKAAMIGNMSVINHLITFGADVEALDFFGRTPVECTRDGMVIQALEKSSGSKGHFTYRLFIDKKIVAYCHSVDDSYVTRLSKCRNKLMTVRKVFNIQNSNLTHLIVKNTHQASLKILIAIVAGLFIIPQEWTDILLEGNHCLPLHDSNRIVKDEALNKGIKNAMINKLLGKPKLFDGLSFFIEGHRSQITINNLSVTKDFLKVLISSGGGKVLLRAPAPRIVGNVVRYPFHASKTLELQRCLNFIIYDDQHPPDLRYNMPELKHKSSKWLINCVVAFSLEPTLPGEDN